MIILLGNIGALMDSVIIVSILIMIPIVVISWLIITRTKFYREEYKITTAINKMVFVGGFLVMAVILLIIAFVATYRMLIK
jgi:hypothetical protein